MASLNTIGILIAAKDEASAVIAKTAAQTKAATGEINALGAESSKAGGLLSGGLIPSLLAVGGVIAVFSEAAHKAGDFQAQLTKLVTSAGESANSLALVNSGIKGLALQTGDSVTELADAMYKVESGGQHGAAGLIVLKAAAQGAKAEGSDLTTTADALTSVLVDYHLKAEDAATVTSKLVAATAAGKMSFQDLAAAMPAILPVASAAHVSLNDVLGDMASMTVHGMSAQQAAENLTDVIRHMQAPTALQGKELALLGLTTTQLADDMKTHGLSGTLQEISTRIQNLMPPGSDKVILDLKTALNGLSPAVKELGMHLFDGTMSAKDYGKAALALDPISAKQAASFATLAGSMHRIGDQQMTGASVMQNYGQALSKATGDATGLKVALMLAGENYGVTTDAIKSISGASAEAGNNVKGWAEIQGNFNTKWSQFHQLISVGLLTLGQKLLPVLTTVVGSIVDFGMKIEGSKQKVIDVARQVSAFLTPSFENLGRIVGTQVVPTLERLWTEVLVPLIKLVGGLFVVAVRAAVDVLAALLTVVTPVVNFLITNKDFLIPIIGGFVALKAAMMLQEAFSVLQAGFLILSSNSIPALIAQVTGLDALIAAPIAMPAIAVGAALAAIALVYNAAMQARDAVNAASDAKSQLASEDSKLVNHFVAVYKDPNSDANAKALAKKFLHNDGVGGYALGTNFATGGLTMVGENGPELVNLPTGSKVHTAKETQQAMGQGGGTKIIINGGMNISNQMDEQKFLANLGWRLSLR